MLKNFQVEVIVAVLLLGVISSTVMGQEVDCLFEDPCLPIGCDAVAPESSHCLFSDHQYLTGNWGGARDSLTESGVNFQADITQFYFGVVNGGVQREFRYAGHGDYVLNLDGGKLGIQEGLFVKIRAEHRFGETLAGATGAVLPSTLLADLPARDEGDLLLTNLLFTQAFSENFAVFFGKLDTLDGDENAFAHGRGKTQFSNSAFVANPIALRTTPYSTLGAGFVYLEDGEPVFTFTVLNPVDTVSTSGFSELFAEGVTLTGELRLKTNFINKPGHQLFGATWSSRDYISLDQDPRIILPNVPIARSSGSWSLYWNFDQHLVTDAADPSRGWGVFGRAGIADGDTNPLAWIASFGVGGSSPLPNRKGDSFGAGYYYTGISNEIGPIISAAVGGQGIELYYRTEITPWFHITPDVQFLFPGRQTIDSTTVVGIRSNLSF